MTQSSYSKDTLTQVLIDKVISAPPQDKIEVRKQKIVFGPDGAYTDVTSLTPFPVSGTFVLGAQGWSNFSQDTPKQVDVLDTSTVLLEANSLRLSAQFINNSEQRIYIQYGIDSIYGRGYPVETNTIFTITQEDLFLGRVSAVTETGFSVQIDVIEGVA